jgi:microcompartment protein CcmL/EutN
MAEKSIGLVELSSVAAGFQVADTMLKAGNVRLILSRSICSGKYMVLIGGETAGVEAAVNAGAEAANGCLIDSFVIANVHPDVFVALGRTQPVQPDGAFGVLESFNVATLIQASDAVAKSAAVQLLEIRLAMALGGKAFCTMTGDVASVDGRCGLRECRCGCWPPSAGRCRCARKFRGAFQAAPGCVSRGGLSGTGVFARSFHNLGLTYH